MEEDENTTQLSAPSAWEVFAASEDKRKNKKEQKEKMKIRKKPPHHLASTGAQVDKVAKRLLLPPCATALLPSSEVAAKVSSGYDSEPSLEVITHHLSFPFPLPPLPPSVYLTGPPPFPPSLSSLYLTG